MTSDDKAGTFRRGKTPIPDHHQYDQPDMADDVLDEVFSEANPNPGRVGCPPRDALRELALKQRPIDDPGYVHLSECSPCYVEFRELQKSSATTAHGSGSIAKRIAAAAAIVLIAAGGVWFFLVARDGRFGAGSTSSQGAGVAIIATELDLRPYAVQRNDQNRPAQPPLLLPRGRLHVTILLPVGAEPGPYEVKVLDADLKTRSSAIGIAIIRDFVTTLTTDLDLRALLPGAYQFGVRRQDEDWRLLSAQVTQ